ncbi:NUDIX hydrolase [Vibrio intestinalis]|uniref:NUDIX hydrolase n=1 Tax=Vibrio intestinalis TaxID=2933291 RepID=UPI0021A9525A|nr:NUDIX domain-containing protein [Vibrio intestinalis]
MDVHQCVSFMLVSQNRVLLEKRGAERDTDAGMTNIPGGHMESGEEQKDTLMRELMEELQVTPVRSQYLCSLYHPTSELQLIHYYVVTQWQGEITALEAECVEWFDINPDNVTIDADKVALKEYQRLSAHLILK